MCQENTISVKTSPGTLAYSGKEDTAIDSSVASVPRDATKGSNYGSYVLIPRASSLPINVLIVAYSVL